MKLEDRDEISSLQFHIPARKLEIFHSAREDDFAADLESLNFGAEKLETVESEDLKGHDAEKQRRLLKSVLVINALFFVGELLFGYLSNSMGLIADSLDMLADALVYSLSLWAVGQASRQKKKIAGWSGYLQLGLAVLGILEVTRRFLEPDNLVDYKTMIPVAFGALLANGFCLYLLNSSGNLEEAHMQASKIFTSNDIIINLGVISAGFLVFIFDSALPDLIIGLLVFLVVTGGALRILKVSRG